METLFIRIMFNMNLCQLSITKFFTPNTSQLIYVAKTLTEKEYNLYLMSHPQVPPFYTAILLPEKEKEKKKWQKVEKECLQYYKSRIGETVSFQVAGMYKQYKIKKILPKKGKADTALLLEDPVTGEEVTCGIQTKMGKRYRFTNWVNPIKFPHIQEVRERWKNPETMEILRRRLRKYRKNEPHAQLNKLGLTINNTNRKFGEVTDFRHKKMYILGIDFHYDFFFYDRGRNVADPFDPSRLEWVDDTFINNERMYYGVRSIYSMSGKTNNRMPDIFEGEYQPYLDSIHRD